MRQSDRSLVSLPVTVLALWAIAQGGRGESPPKATPASDADRAHMQEALFKAATGQSDAALRTFDDVLTRNPDCVEAYKLRATVYALRQNFAKAAADCAEAIRRAPGEADAYSMRAVFLFQQGKLDEAIKTYGELITVDPKNDTAYAQRGVLFGRQGKWEKALADFDMAIQLNPRCAEAFAARAGFRSDRGDLAGALADYNSAVAANGENTEARIGLARLLSRSKDDKIRNGEKALEHAKKAVELTQGTDYSALDAMASAYAELGKFKEATEAARKANDICGNVVEAAAIRRRMEQYQAGQPCRE